MNNRIGEESVLDYDHRTGEYHINEMKEMLFRYQKSVALEMLQKGYHGASSDTELFKNHRSTICF